jgi:hypothetical protein
MILLDLVDNHEGSKAYSGSVVKFGTIALHLIFKDFPRGRFTEVFAHVYHGTNNIKLQTFTISWMLD